MRKLFLTFVITVLSITGAATAQQAGQSVVWVQIEAHPSLRVAQQRAQIYADRLADVNGFSLGGNWYGILLGPYARDDAERVLDVYRADGLIPGDSYISFSRSLGAQYWPEGANILNRGTVRVPQVEQTGQQATAPDTPVEPADETPAQARRSERNLTAEERRDLQTALKAAGYYNAAIDGAFGAGTRRSMKDWQIATGHEATGILTTLQRKVLMDQYNAPLISVGMRNVTDVKAGVAMDLPAGAVKFARYEAPFAHYEASGDVPARVLLISQKGTDTTLFGLYEIMQTLEIVPLEGPRERGKDRFTLEGRNKDIVSYTEARLIDGEIKGFTLVWPTGDDPRRERVLAAMKTSFQRTDGVLDDVAGEDDAQDIDLVSGLEVRKPRLSRSGFYIDEKGTVVTTAEAVRGCTRVTIDEEFQANVLTTDEQLGVAVLRPVQTLAPMSVARFSASEARLKSNVTVAGFSYEGVLGAPTLTFGTLADVKGLGGETELTRLALNALPGDAGGPVMDAGGGVVGMLLPAASATQQLPADVSFAADAGAIRSLLSDAGLTAEDNTGTGALAPNDLSRIASGMTVLVGCWD